MAFIKVGEESFGNSFEPIPTGEVLQVAVYDIDKTQVQNGDNKGKDQLVVTYKVTEEGPYKGREIRYNNLALYAGKSAWVLVVFAEAVGWETSKEQGVNVPENYKSVLGAELIVKVGQRTSNANGNVYNTATPKGAVKTADGEPATPAKKASWSDV